MSSENAFVGENSKNQKGKVLVPSAFSNIKKCTERDSNTIMPVFLKPATTHCDTQYPIGQKKVLNHYLVVLDSICWKGLRALKLNFQDK